MSDGLPNIGELVAGRYRILEELGHGGYGVVYRARQDVMGRDVALKVLKPEAAKKSTEVERFRREVFHASGLKHPNTIQLFDFGETNGLFYIVMEFLQGKNLREKVLTDGPFDHDSAVEITLQVLKSLREAHDHGIVHRDLKPENIFLVDTGRDDELFAKVLDFGLSKYVEGSQKAKEPTLTKDGMIFGTPQYMSPEQAYGQKVTPMTDIYALGLLIFEMVTARCAFSGRSSMEILIKQVSQPLPSLPDKLQGTVLSDFVEICTQKDAANRFPNATEAYTWLSRRKQSMSMVQVLSQPLDDMKTPEMTPAVRAPLESPDSYGHVLVLSQDFDLRLASLPLIGRERELDELMLWSRQALYSGGVAWVTGDVGVGKSRVVDEWVRHFEMEGVLVLSGEYLEGGGPLLGLRQALDAVINQDSGDQQTLPQVFSFEQLRALRAVLLSDDMDSSIRAEHGLDAAFACIEQSLYLVASRRPTVLVLENLQWADSFTHRLLEHWQEELATLSIPLLLILTSRSDEVGTSMKLNHISGLGRKIFGQSFAYALHLERLTDADARRMLAHLLPATAAVTTRIQQIARGNPLFITEAVRYLLAAEIVTYQESEHIWDFRPDIGPGEDLIPPSMTELVLGRLKSLVSHQVLGGVLQALILRTVLIGPRFELRILKELLRRESRPDLEFYLDDAIDRFARAGILRPIVIGTQPGLEFSYNLTRKALFDSGIEFSENTSYVHEMLAEIKHNTYDQCSRDRKTELAASIADHYQESLNTPRAHQWWCTAARHAEEAQDFRGALSYLSAAERLLDERTDPDGERLLGLRLDQGRLHRFLGEFGPAEYALSAALEEAQRTGDLVGEAMSAESLASVYTLLGRYFEAVQKLDTTSALYARFPDPLGVLRCEAAHAEILRFQGHYLQAQEAFAQCVTTAESLQQHDIAVRCLYGLGQCNFAAGRLRQAMEVFLSCRKRAEVVGNWRIVTSIDIELAMIAIITDGIARAEQMATAALEAKRRVGDTLGQAHAHLILGMALRRTLRISEAEFHCERALTLNERLSHRYGIGKSILLQAEIAWVKGDLESARRLGAEACKIHEEITDSHGRALSLLYTGLFEAESENLEHAAELIDLAMDLGGQDGLGLYQPAGLLFRGMVFEGRDNLEDAIAYYGEALDLAEYQGNREFASIAAISLAKLHLVMGDIESALQEIPIARNQAERLGNNIALLLALTGEAWLARLQSNPHGLQMALQKLRVLADKRGGANLRVPERLARLATQIVAHQPPAKVKTSLATLFEIIESIGDEEITRELRAKLALFL